MSPKRHLPRRRLACGHVLAAALLLAQGQAALGEPAHPPGDFDNAAGHRGVAPARLSAKLPGAHRPRDPGHATALANVAGAQHRHTLPLVLAASSAAPGGFIRIVNRSPRAGTVRLHAFDDTGRRFGPVTLSLDAQESVQLNASHLESGNASKGLSAGIGDGQGHWRLELDTPLDIEALSYARSADGSLASLHEVVANESMRHHVLTFNPASNLTKRSLLRLVNPSGLDAQVLITGRDDRGEAPPEGAVRLTLAADTARTLSAQALEAGAEGIEGRFGDGAGEWQVFVSADRPIQVMSLLASPGNLVNLSAGPGDDVIRGGPGSDELFGGNRDDVLDPGDNDDGVDIVHGSAGNDRIVYTASGPSAAQELRYSALSAGITATIDGPANRATVVKGTAGTDTLVDVANPLRAGTTSPYGDFWLSGTPSADVFDLTLDDEQWMMVGGGAGADTFNIVSGAVGLNYEQAPGGISVDLGAGRARNDGHGDTDTIKGRVRHVRGSDFSDVITGSGNDESFMGRQGNDVIDGGGGSRDRLLFLYRGRPDLAVVENLNVDLGRGTATGTWKGNAFSYRISNIEEVRGGAGSDVIRGNAGANYLYGYGGDDELYGGDGDDELYGGSGNDVLDPGDNDNGYDWISGSVGNDRIVYTDAGPRAYQEIDYSDLGVGIRATIDGATNRGTIAKGSAGTDTLVDITNPLGWGFGLHGTRSDDVFDLTLGDGQWMSVRGRAGNDTFNIHTGSDSAVRVDYRSSPAGIHVDLGAGRVRNDGHGDTDTIRGRVWEIRGSDFSDTIIGSGNDESFIGRAGNDRIDGGGGFDRLRFDRFWNVIIGLDVDLEDGTAEGVWDGKAFSYKVSNIEEVRGSYGDDRLSDGPGNDKLDGGEGDDILSSVQGNDTLTGGSGYDIFFVEPAGDRVVTITDLRSDRDGLMLNLHGLSSHADLSAVMSDTDDGVTIDLSGYGGGRIILQGIKVDDLGAANFLL